MQAANVASAPSRRRDRRQGSGPSGPAARGSVVPVVIDVSGPSQAVAGSASSAKGAKPPGSLLRAQDAADAARGWAALSVCITHVVCIDVIRTSREVTGANVGLPCGQPGFKLCTASAGAAAPAPAAAAAEKPPPWIGRKGTSRIQVPSSAASCWLLCRASPAFLPAGASAITVTQPTRLFKQALVMRMPMTPMTGSWPRYDCACEYPPTIL